MLSFQQDAIGIRLRRGRAVCGGGERYGPLAFGGGVASVNWNGAAGFDVSLISLHQLPGSGDGQEMSGACGGWFGGCVNGFQGSGFTIVRR